MIKDLDKIILVGCARVISPAIHLTNPQVGCVVIDDCPHALPITNRGARGVGKIYQEGLVRFDQQIAVDGDVERVSGLARGYGLIQQVAGHIVIVRRSRTVVRGGDVKVDAAGRGSQGRSDGES